MNATAVMAYEFWLQVNDCPRVGLEREGPSEARIIRLKRISNGILITVSLFFIMNILYSRDAACVPLSELLCLGQRVP